MNKRCGRAAGWEEEKTKGKGRKETDGERKKSCNNLKNMV